MSDVVVSYERVGPACPIDLGKRIKASLERVTAFYAEQGVVLNSPVSFTYVGEEFPSPDGTLAMVIAEAEAVQKLGDHYMQQVITAELSSRWQKKYPTDDAAAIQAAADQFAAVTIERASKLRGETEDVLVPLRAYGSDILIFSTLGETLALNPGREDQILDRVLSHELFHVVELQKGLLNPYLSEGAAEFARKMYQKAKGIKGTIETPEDTHSLAFIGAERAKYLYEGQLEAVKLYAASLQDLFDMQKRALIEAKFKQNLMDSLRFSLDESETRKEPTKEEKAILRSLYPEFFILRTGLTKENLLAGFRNAGLDKGAAWLEGKDCKEELEEYGEAFLE